MASDELRDHINTSLNGFKPFSLSLQGISHEPENYLFLNLIRGQEQIIKIHNLLYSGIIARFLSKQHDYKPHITVGRLKNLSATQTGMNKLEHFDHEFTTEVNKISSEIILDNFTSAIDFEITLADYSHSDIFG
ncbi:MAG: 2'-5' RNA ligase family protein [Pleurocapsa sp. CRU_1_2]|nr:2'-5' RNA ligase family protein [Pleurocapsa sp. CRU_1_2]